MNKEKKILPSGWKEVCLGDVFVFSAGGDVDKDAFSKEKNNEHPYPIYANALTNAGLYGYSSKYKIDKECITITGRGDIGKVFYRNIKYTPIVRLITAIPKENLNAKFLSYAVSKINFFIETTGVPQLTIPQVKPYKMIIPESLEEQERIAEVLGCADSVIELIVSKISKLKLQKKSLMQKLLTPKPHWETSILSKYAKIYQSQTISSTDLKKEGFPVWGANGIIGFYNKFNHDTWQVIITCRGSTCGTVNKTSGKTWITGNAMVINCDDYNVDKLFLYYYLLNQKFHNLVTGSGQPQIVKAPLEKYKISIPPLKEQDEIAEVLKTQDAVISLNEQKLQNLKLQKKSLMQKLLTGKWRI